MKLLLATMLLFGSIQGASALQNASTQDRLDITTLLNARKEAGEAIKVQAKALESASGDAALASGISAEIRRLEKVQTNAAEQAIWLTIRAYDIIPFAGTTAMLPVGKSFLRSPELGKTIVWIPAFEVKHPYKLQDAGGNIVGKPLDLIDAGNTASDGVSRIFPEAFMSPVELASLLLHEKLHFEQITDPLRAPKMTPGEMEVEAYTAEQNLLNNGPFIFDAAETARQTSYVTKNIGLKTAQARRERAELAKGHPPLDVSIISHQPLEIDGLIAQARAQVKIAQRDHDARLKTKLGNLTFRSCTNPGSVSQEELNNLPQPFDDGFYNGKDPSGVGTCNAAYLYLAQGGRDAAKLNNLSTPELIPQPEPPPTEAVQPVPPVARQNPPPPFSSAFRQMSDFARAACAAPEQVPIGPFITRFYDYSNADADLELAGKYAANLDGCSKLLFSQLYGTMRAQKGWGVDRQWIRAKVGEYSPGQGPSSGNTSPQNGKLPPNSDPCRDNGNKYCP
jgi:hypothetical protein